MENPFESNDFAPNDADEIRDELMKEFSRKIHLDRALDEMQIENGYFWCDVCKCQAYMMDDGMPSCQCS